MSFEIIDIDTQDDFQDIKIPEKYKINDDKVYIKKTEDGIKVRFGRGWDKETMEALLETLWRRNGK